MTATEPSTSSGARSSPRKTVRPAASASDPDAPEGGTRGLQGGPDDRGPSRLPWILAAIGLLGTLVFGIAWLSARGDGDAAGGSGSSDVATTEELKATSTEFSEALTNFDGATIDRDFDALTAMATGEFRSQVDQFFSSEIRAQLKEAQASSRGEVRSAYVQTAEVDRGTVFVVVDQTIANNQSPQPQSDTLRMELGLLRVDGTWRIERVSVLTAPSGGSSSIGGVTEAPTTTEAGG